MKAYQADIAKFEATDTQVLGVSMDSFAVSTAERLAPQSDQRLWSIQRKDGLLSSSKIVIDKEGIIRHVEEGRTAIDPTGAYQACSIFDKKG